MCAHVVDFEAFVDPTACSSTTVEFPELSESSATWVSGLPVSVGKRHAAKSSSFAQTSEPYGSS